MKILVGAGQDAASWSRDGWVCNDLPAAKLLYPDISMVAPCWALPVEDGSVDEIMAKGMLEHLTYHEVVRSFAEWRRVLRSGGFATFEVPDVEEYIHQYMLMKERGSTGEGDDAGVSEEPNDREVCSGIDRWLRRALWGWQRYPGDEHRSGWTEGLVRFYTEKYFSTKFEIRRMAISFNEDVPVSRIRHLWTRVWK